MGNDAVILSDTVSLWRGWESSLYGALLLPHLLREAGVGDRLDYFTRFKTHEAFEYLGQIWFHLRQGRLISSVWLFVTLGLSRIGRRGWDRAIIIRVEGKLFLNRWRAALIKRTGALKRYSQQKSVAKIVLGESKNQFCCGVLSRH
jgi:hypothetical protein